MIIKGIEFPFSPLNATDMDRLNAATRQSELESAAEKQRVQQGAITDMAQIIRGQCRIVHNYLENLLGAGACEKLALDGNDLNSYRAVINELTQKTSAELASLHTTIPEMQHAAAFPTHKKHHKKKGGHK
ncbi:MAG: hypothetical protein IJ347_09495 [Faecalibacterium sp.]|nr:hypothetical protein [Faecalibacterium sp.]